MRSGETLKQPFPYSLPKDKIKILLLEGISDTAVAVLKDADLVTERREGTRRFYRANTDTMAELRAFLDDYWTSGLERLRDVAEAAEARKRQDKGGRHGRARS